MKNRLMPYLDERTVWAGYDQKTPVQVWLKTFKRGGNVIVDIATNEEAILWRRVCDLEAALHQIYVMVGSQIDMGEILDLIESALTPEE